MRAVDVAHRQVVGRLAHDGRDLRGKLSGRLYRNLDPGAALATAAVLLLDLPLTLAELPVAQVAAGLAGEALTLRITGCPNGCARPYNADIAFVGRRVAVFVHGCFWHGHKRCPRSKRPT